MSALPVFIYVADARREQDRLVVRLQVTRGAKYIEETHVLYQHSNTPQPPTPSTPWSCREIIVKFIH